MIHYTLSCPKPYSHLLELEAKFPCNNLEHLELQLPSWRPGRYELGDFAKNIKSWSASNEAGKPLAFEKITKDKWTVACKGESHVVVKYAYYAAELNAGSTFVSTRQMYVNPVNCFLYIPDNQDLPYSVKLNVTDSYQLATQMEQLEKNVMVAPDVQAIMDSPFIASAELICWKYEVEDVVYSIWILGPQNLDKAKISSHFKAFTEAQVKAFGSIPCKEYQFLFEMPEEVVRHGVEHSASTVIAMGPGLDYSHGEGYRELLGISSHELYHTWNVKNIRPKEMMPYDFSKENYSKLGYVTEGVTTYFGDQFLVRSGVFSKIEYLVELGRQIQRHYDNPGRFNLSVADSSFDTWLDGYVRGIPHRKVSIYVEGCLIAFICDVRILEATEGRASLDEIMKQLYMNFGQKQIGYVEQDYLDALEQVSGVSFEDIRKDLIHGCEDYTPYLKKAFAWLGIEWHREESEWWETHMGVQIKMPNNVPVVWEVWPGSPAMKAGLWRNDVLLKANGIELGLDWYEQLQMLKGPELELESSKRNHKRNCELIADGIRYYENHQLTLSKPNPKMTNWKSWLRS